MANDISVNLVLQNRQYTRELQKSRQAMEHFGRVGVSQATMALVKQSNAVRFNTSLMQNAIFAVEDAASVYGTSGLAGSLRAASNNLTMMAAAFGPWAMAATVAVTTATQLYMAFNKGKKEADDYSDSLKNITSETNRVTQAARDRVRFQQQIRDVADADEGFGMAKNLRDEAAQSKAEIAALVEQIKRVKDLREEAVVDAAKQQRAWQRWAPDFAIGDMVGDAAKPFDKEIAELMQQRKRLEADRLNTMKQIDAAEVRAGQQVDRQVAANQKLATEKKRQLEIQNEQQRAAERQEASNRLSDAIDRLNAKRKEDFLKRQRALQQAQQDGASGGTRGSLEAAKAIQSFRAGNGTLNAEKLAQQQLAELRKLNRKKQREVTIGVGMPGFN